jgi:asparagine synthase (glutamine-hydrolysing)
MSGFVAAVRENADPDLGMRLQDMSRIIAHRGDRETATRLSDRCSAITRDRKQAGYGVDTFCDGDFGIVLDGLLSNTNDLRHAIGADSTTGSAEVVLRGYLQFGDKWLADIDGSFALMIIDLKSGETIVARDRFGHRPLYFGTVNGDIWVGSELKALITAPGYRPSVNKDILYSSIAYGITPGPQTLFSSFLKVVPGFAFRITAQGNHEAIDYFTPTLDLNPVGSLRESKETILNNLRTSVEHYISECPKIGTMLSGGVDSALLAHLTAELADDQAVALGFGAEGWSDDESEIAGETAAQVGMRFSRARVSIGDNLMDPLRNVVSILEEPTRFENALALEVMLQGAAQNCNAVMTGEGADFILGEREHAVAKRLSRILRIPGFLRVLLRKLPLEKSGFWNLRALAPYLDWTSIRDYGQKCSANCCDLVAGFDGPPHSDIPDMLANVTSGWPVETQYTFMTLREAAHCWIERMEKISAAAGLECFHPFETNGMFQFGLEMPDLARNSKGVTKPAVRSLAADIFGESFAYRQKKQLAAPMQLWLNESAQLREAVLKLKRPDSRIREYLDSVAVDKYLEIYEKEGAQGESVAVPIFRMLTFEIWLEMFM